MANQFFVFLPSNTPKYRPHGDFLEEDYPDNGPNKFRVRLPKTIYFSGSWVCALHSISYPYSWPSTVGTLDDQAIFIHFTDDGGTERTIKVPIPKASHEKVEKLHDFLAKAIQGQAKQISEHENDYLKKPSVLDPAPPAKRRRKRAYIPVVDDDDDIEDSPERAESPPTPRSPSPVNEPEAKKQKTDTPPEKQKTIAAAVKEEKGINAPVTVTHPPPPTTKNIKKEDEEESGGIPVIDSPQSVSEDEDEPTTQSPPREAEKQPAAAEAEKQPPPPEPKKQPEAAEVEKQPPPPPPKKQPPPETEKQSAAAVPKPAAEAQPAAEDKPTAEVEKQPSAAEKQPAKEKPQAAEKPQPPAETDKPPAAEPVKPPAAVAIPASPSIESGGIPVIDDEVDSEFYYNDVLDMMGLGDWEPGKVDWALVQRLIQSVEIKYLDDRQRFQVFLKDKAIKYLSFTPQLGYVLGWNNGQYVVDKETAKYGCDLRGGFSSFAVYSRGLTENVIIGNSLSSLLRVVSVTGAAPGEYHEKIYDSPIFARVLPREINEIEIELRTLDDGRLVPFAFGAVMIVLIFKKVINF